MIYLQLQTNSVKIGPSVPSISLNLAKRPNDGSGKGNSCRLFVKCGKEYMHFQTEIRYILQKFKLKREKDEFVRCVTHVYAVYNLVVCSTIFFFQNRCDNQFSD